MSKHPDLMPIAKVLVGLGRIDYHPSYDDRKAAIDALQAVENEQDAVGVLVEVARRALPEITEAGVCAALANALAPFEQQS